MDRAKLKVKSPCTGQCYIDPQTKLCTGCYRTDMEVFDWSTMDVFDRMVVLEHVKKRKTAIAESTESE